MLKLIKSAIESFKKVVTQAAAAAWKATTTAATVVASATTTAATSAWRLTVTFVKKVATFAAVVLGVYAAYYVAPGATLVVLTLLTASATSAVAGMVIGAAWVVRDPAAFNLSAAVPSKAGPSKAWPPASRVIFGG